MWFRLPQPWPWRGAEDAEPLYERALAIYEKALGPEHPDTANSLNNLAALYRKQGRDAEGGAPGVSRPGVGVGAVTEQVSGDLSFWPVGHLLDSLSGAATLKGT